MFAAVMLACVPAPCFCKEAKDTITWLEVHMPPFLIQEGPQQGQGYGNMVAALIEQQLPDYEHHRLTTNVTRRFDMFKRGDQVCSVGLYRTPEREDFLYFSIPSLLTMPPVLVIHKKQLHLLNTEGVSLVTLLRNSEFRLGLSSDRSYGAALDAVLKQSQPIGNRVVFSGQELGENYLKMLLLDRLDGLLALPDEALYHADNMGIREQIALVPLLENQQDLSSWMCAVACPKNDWGRTVIDRVNQALLHIRGKAVYRRAYERWLDPTLLTRYRRVYDTTFLATRP